MVQLCCEIRPCRGIGAAIKRCGEVGYIGEAILGNRRYQISVVQEYV
jgi:hypothetical protein